jgi:Sugar kinases, ribokinase family
VKFYCRNFLCTAGAEQVSLRTGTISKVYSIPPLEAVSTIGAGDNFNAGIIFGLL